MEKTVNKEIKASLQPPSRTKKIGSRYPNGYRLSKNDKIKAHQDYWNGDKNKSIQHPTLANNTSQPQTQASKNNKYY